MDMNYNFPVIALKALTDYQPKDYQFNLDGRELFDESYSYVDRPTEIEAYRCTVEEARKIGMSDDALKALLAYDWPGNVRELENCLERAYAFTSGPVIHVTDLPREIANLPAPQPSAGGGNGHSKIISMAELEKQTILNAIAELNGDKLQAARLLGIGKTTLYRKLKDYAAEKCWP